MKTKFLIASFLLMVSVIAALAQRINPATGLPESGSGPQKFDSATGLPQSNLHDVWQKAKDLMNQRQYEASLQCFTNYIDESRFDQNEAAYRFSALGDWADLGRRYPEAKRALLELRDSNAEKLLNGDGDFVLFGEVNVINADLGQSDASYTLFKAIDQRNPQLAGQCYLFVEDQLVAKGDYTTCRKYMGDPESNFQRASNMYRMQMASEVQMKEIRQRQQHEMQKFFREHTNLPAYTPPDTSQMLENQAKNRFIQEVRGLVEILVATGDKADAEKIQKEALAVLDDPRLETAVSDADEKFIQQINTGDTGKQN